MFNPSAMMGGGSGSGTSGGSSSGGMNVFDPNAMMGGKYRQIMGKSLSW